MPDTCPNCQMPMPPGATTCAVCNSPAAAVPPMDPVALAPAADPIPAPVIVDQTPPQPTNHSLGVLAAFALPVIATVVIVSLLGVIGYGVFNLLHRLVPKTPAAVQSTVMPPPQEAPASPVSVRPSPMASDPAPAPLTAVPAAPTPPPKAAVVLPEPELTSFSPAVAGKGMFLALDGTDLAGVNQVLLISSAGAKSVSVKPVYARRSAVAVRIPDVPFADDDIIIAAVAPGGVAVLIDEHTGATPWGEDGHLHDTTVIAKTGETIDTLVRMVVLARSYSTVSMGDNSFGFLSDHVTLTAHGKNCKIYYVAPITLAPGVSKDGLIEVPSIDVQAPGPAFRVKPAEDR